MRMNWLQKLFSSSKVEETKITDKSKAIDWVEHCIRRASDKCAKEHGDIYFWYCVIYNEKLDKAYTTNNGEIYTFNAAVIQNADEICKLMFNINSKIKQEYERTKQIKQK